MAGCECSQSVEQVEVTHPVKHRSQSTPFPVCLTFRSPGGQSFNDDVLAKVRLFAASAFCSHAAKQMRWSGIFRLFLYTGRKMRRRGALLHKSSNGPTAPIPGQTYPTTFVTGIPGAV